MAEWIKFFAVFFENEESATKKFEKIENEYKSLLNLVEEATYKPVVMTDIPWKGTWFMPGGKSYTACLIETAGATYIISDNNSREASPVGLETVMMKAMTCDFWINCGSATSKADIIAIDERLANLPPLINDKIYNNNAISNNAGGNDYLESGVVNPHIILKDLICIFHPYLLPNHKLVYYKKLN